MKKLILLLLISGGLSAQVVIPKSTTTFSNVSATGTLKVASTSTLVGKVRIGANTAPYATLDVTGTMSVSGTSTLTGAAKQTNTLNYEGNTTWNTNQTNTLTTGNTGTVAVLSDAVFNTNFQSSAYNPTDGYVNHVGTITFNGNTSANSARFYVPYNVTLVSAQINIYTAGTLASSESSTLAISVDGSSTNLLTAITQTAVVSVFTVSGLSQNINAGSLVEAKLTAPTWATNPTTVLISVVFNYVRRQ